LVHVDQAAQLLATQSTGHAWALQVNCSTAAPHASPPWLETTRTDRLRVWTPLPHVVEHGVNMPQPDIAQSTGQAWVLHTRSRMSGHSSPPCMAVLIVATGRF
jgi:hypothetical protein